jgi:tetratricopeptide (TPR) repeat protein
MSNYFGRYSPDGKWIVFCKAKSFMLLQPDSELYIVPAEGSAARRMRCNTARMNSWHSWSPNGKWLVFSSKANGPYTQLCLTHVDERGEDAAPVLLTNLTSPDRAANIPEFVNADPRAITKIHEQFVEDITFIQNGEGYLRGREYARAEMHFRRAIEMNPDNARAHDGLGVALAMQGKAEDAMAEHAEALRLNPNSPEPHFHMGVDLALRGDTDRAAAQYAEALRADAGYAPAHTKLGMLLAARGRTEEADAHFLEAVRLNPSDATAHYGLARSLASQGRLDEAIVHYDAALKANPAYAPAHNNMGAALAAQGKFDEAISHFSAALRIDPQFEQARANLTKALQEKERRRGP